MLQEALCSLAVESKVLVGCCSPGCKLVGISRLCLGCHSAPAFGAADTGHAGWPASCWSLQAVRAAQHQRKHYSRTGKIDGEATTAGLQKGQNRTIRVGNECTRPTAETEKRCGSSLDAAKKPIREYEQHSNWRASVFLFAFPPVIAVDAAASITKTRS